MKKNKRTRICILGGSFNPCTIGHIKIAELVLKHDLVDKVWLMPNFNHNHGKKLIDPFHRIEMLYRSIKGKKNIEICQYEILTESDGKMFETVEHLIEANPYTDFSIIIGMDCALEISRWYNWEKLIQLVPFIVIDRECNWVDDTRNWFDIAPHIVIKNKFKHEYSSTLAREAIKNNDNEAQERLMCRSVIDYIKTNEVYK